MECIPYINDLKIEIEMLKELNKNNKYSDDSIEKLIKQKEDLMNKCKENLEKLSDNDIYYRIYLCLLNGMTVNQTINKIADENYQRNVKPNSFNGIWNYYTKIKKIIKK